MQDFLGRFGQTRKCDATERTTLDEKPAFANGNAALGPIERQLARLAVQCRERREELSMLIMAVSGGTESNQEIASVMLRRAKRALSASCAPPDSINPVLMSLSGDRVAAIIPNCDREAAVTIAKSTVAEFAKLTVPTSELEVDRGTLNIGVATASVVPKNFDPARMIERAERCLSAARSCGNSSVKSIEV
jgi:GGDEF domain-containing protein